MTATVSFHQRGYAGRRRRWMVRDGDKLLAAQDVTLAADGTVQTETMFFQCGGCGGEELSV